MKKWYKRILLALAGLIILLGISIAIVLHTVLTPSKVTPLALQYANEYLDAGVDCESVEITFFSTFPNLGLLLKNGEIVNPVAADSLGSNGLPQDTLVSFQKCLISFNPGAFLFDRKIIVNKLELTGAGIYAYNSLDGRANWEILPSDTVVGREEKTSFQRPEMNIKDVRITDANIIYDDRQLDLFASIDSLQLSIDGNMSKDLANLDLDMETNALTFFYEGQAYAKRLPLGVRASLKNNRIDHSLIIKQALINIGVLEFDANGSLQRDSVVRQAKVDINFQLNASSLDDLMKMVPEQLTDIDDQIITTGKIESQGKITGYLGKETYPVLTMSLNMKDGSLRSMKHKDKQGLKKIEITADALIDLSAQESSYIHIENLFLQSVSSSVHCSGKFDNIFTRPEIQMDIDGKIDFDRMSQDFTFVRDMKMGGLIRLDLSGKCFLDDILAADYGKIDATGKLDIEQVVFKYPKENIDFFAPSASLLLGSNVKDSIRGREVESLLRGQLDLDSIYVNYNNELQATIGKLSARFHTSESKDTAQIAVVATTARAEKLRLILGDSVRINATKSEVRLRLAPEPDNPSQPELSARINLDTLRIRMPELNSRVNNAGFNLKIKRQTPRVRPGTGRVGRDSTYRASRLDSIRRQDPESYLSFQLESNEAKSFLRKWDVSGSFECKNMRLRTPYFPLPLRMTQSSLDFTINSLIMNNLRMKAGSSDMVLNGKVDGIRQALLRNGRLSAKLSLEADSIDFNQLIRAIASGSEYTGKEVAQRDSISKIILDDTKESVEQADDTALNEIFIVPRNIDFELDTRIKKVKFSNLRLENASGKIIIRNQSLRLPDFRLISDIGNAQLSLVYKAPDRKGASLGMDLQMNRIYVKELIHAFPVIDTLAPMLRSFEGVVDCKMTVMTSLDSLSNVVLPKTTASCYLSGVNMVLLDGETFTEISKMLMFKNKKRNLIDSIAVEMIMENNKLMVFPFKLAMDRYVAAVGGVQNLDMSFDYHITLLKSPLPLKIGINLTGTIDKYKIRLAKPKYSDLFSPAREQSLASTQINLRQQMYESLKKSIDEIINEPANSTARRPQVTLSDSLKREFFELDTTSVAPLPIETSQ